MSISQLLRCLKEIPQEALLAIKPWRLKLLLKAQQKYYDELDITVPLSFDLKCPIHFAEAWWSFSEIFIQQECAAVFDLVPLPDRWLDIGAHAGFFSLYVIWLRAKRRQANDFSALLIDADRRVEPAVNKLRSLNNLLSQIKFKHGAISRGHGAQPFILRSHMASSLKRLSDLAGIEEIVERIDPGDILATLPAPYDLIKLDIEGAEYDFFVSYKPVIERAKYILLEWHSWHTGGGGFDQLSSLAQDLGLAPISEVTAPHKVFFNAAEAECGVILYRNRRLT